MSFLLAFYVGALVLPKENSPGNVIEARMYIWRKLSLHMIEVTGGSAA